MATHSPAPKSIETQPTHIPDFVYEKFPDQYVAITNDRTTVLANAPTGPELMGKLHKAGHDPKSYFIKRVHAPGTILIL